MNATDDRELSRNLRPRPPRVWYGIAVLTLLVGSGSVLPLVPVLARTQTRPQTRLTRALLAVAKPKIAELREKLQDRVGTIEVIDRYMRAPQCVLGEITGAHVTKGTTPGTYKGVVNVACEWMSPDQMLFDTRQEAEEAELVEAEPGSMQLLYTYQGGKWTFQRMRKN